MKKTTKQIPLTSEKKETTVYELKIAVLGKSLVGKSALTYRFINDKFPTEHDTTIEDQYRVNVKIENFDCRLGKQFIEKFIV
jgi:GTPase SAR1 family protein